jgi:CubicO group peptidase (beta-lactamase class C family)
MTAMTRFVPALVTLLGLTSCTLPTNQARMKGPQAGPAGAVLPAGWIDNAHKPVWPVTDNGSGYGWGWWVPQDGGYEATGAYGQSVTIYPKDDVVIAVNAASRDPHGFGIARWRLLRALDVAAVGRSDPNDKAK